MKEKIKKVVIDTNVPITANLAIAPDEIPNELLSCVNASIKEINKVIRQGGLVLDDGDEIFTEYRSHLNLKGQPGVGDAFIKWVNDHRFNAKYVDKVLLHKIDDSYEEFPLTKNLQKFDPSDHKFVAVANQHPEKPQILQATDSKWWGFKAHFQEVGIEVIFLCTDYVKSKYQQKN